MTKKNIHCSLAGLGRTMALQTQGRHEVNDIAGSGRRGLGEDDDAVGLGTAWVIGVVSLGTVRGAQRHGLGEDNVVVGSGTASWAWG
jgi:hypothetical protein